MIEMLVVIGILILLTALMWSPRTGRREQARMKVCKSQLERVFIAMQIYAQDFGAKFPVFAGATNSTQPLALLVPRYTSDAASFICPGSQDALKTDEPFSRQKISFSYYMGCGPSEVNQPLLTDAQIPSGLPDRFHFSKDGKPPGNNHGKAGGNVLFCDGHVEFRRPGAAFPAGAKGLIQLLNP